MTNNTPVDFTHPMILEYLRVETERYREIQREREERMSQESGYLPHGVWERGDDIPRMSDHRHWANIGTIEASSRAQGHSEVYTRNLMYRYARQHATPAVLTELRTRLALSQTEEQMNTNVQDPLERRSREALNENIQRLKTQQEENSMMVPKEIALLIEKHPASTVTLALIRKATKLPVPVEVIGDSAKLTEWLESLGEITWKPPVPIVSPDYRTQGNARSVSLDGLYFDGDYANFDWRGCCDVSADVQRTAHTTATTYGTCSIDIDNLADEDFDSIEDLAEAIANEISEPEMEYDRDSIDFEDEDHEDVDWDSLSVDNYCDAEMESSRQDIREFAQWLVDNGVITLHSDDDE